MSLIGWWKLDGDVNDSSGYGNHGSISGSPILTNGKIGQCYETGISSFLYHPLITFLDKQEYSFSAWIKWTGGEYLTYILPFGQHGVSSNTIYFSNDGGTTDSVFRYRNASGTQTITNGTHTWFSGDWYHILWTVDENRVIRVYENGTLKTSHTLITSDMSYSGIGRGYNSNSYVWKGLIDDVRVYNHALSAKEAKELSKAKVAHYKFENNKFPVNFTSSTKSGVAVYTNEITKTATTSGWDSGAISDQSFTGNCYLEWQMKYLDSTHGAEMVGFNYNHSTWSYTDIDYAIYTHYNGDIRIYENGSDIGSFSTWDLSLDNIFRIEYVGGYVYYYHNNNIIRKSTASHGSSPLYFDCSMHSHGAANSIYNYKIGNLSNKIYDSSGYNYNGKFNDYPLVWEKDINCVSNGCYNFIKNSSRYINLDSEIVLSNEWSLSIRAYQDIDEVMIIGKQGTNYNRFYSLGGGTYWRVHFNNGVYKDLNIVSGNWLGGFHNHTFVFTGTSFLFYLDGVLQDTETVSTSEVMYINCIGNGYTDNVYSWDGKIDEIIIYNTALSSDNITEKLNQKLSIDKKGKIFIPNIIETKHKPLLMDYTVWEDGQWGVVGDWSIFSNGNGRILGLDPWGKEVVLWISTTQNPTTTTYPSQGGIYHNAQSIDNTKMYRASWWEKRVTNNGATYGPYYAGCNGYGSVAGVLNRSNGNNNTNPYFWSTSHTGLPINVWVLVVGHIWPVGSGIGSNHTDSGRYKLDGYYGSISFDFVFRAETTTFRTRTLTIYRGNVAGMVHYTAYPRLDVCDGTEPSIDDLLNGYDSRHYDYIKSKGGSYNISLDIGKSNTYTGNISETGPANGLVGWWKLDGDAEDYTENSNNGTVSGATVTNGLKQMAYEFDGSSDYITISDADVLKPTELTISTWFNITTWDGNRQIFFTKWNGWSVEIGTDQKPYFRVANCGDSPSGNIVLTNIWYHFVGTYKKDVGNSLYINGDLVGTTYTGNDITHSTNVLRLGYYSSTLRLLGKQQDCRIYNRALDAKEIKTLFNTYTGNNIIPQVGKNNIYTIGEFKEI